MRTKVVTLGVTLAAIAATGAGAQELPLPPLRGSEQGVTPAYEGWYDAPDGSHVLYFGYNNRNAEEVVEIPIGENNFIEPAQFDGAQPTEFEPGRDWGVFGIRVPADFPTDERVYWNLVVHGRTYRVPGHLDPNWKTDAAGGGASDAFPAELTAAGATGAGPMGVTAPQTLHGRVGQGVELTVGVKQRGAANSGLAAAFGAVGGVDALADQAASANVDPDVIAAMMGGGQNVTWFKHQGPGDVTFSSPTGRVSGPEGEVTTVATFDAPGDYVIRARVVGGDMPTSGHAQCCWSNAYFRVSVTQ